jgi:hypothetical protein
MQVPREGGDVPEGPTKASFSRAGVQAGWSGALLNRRACAAHLPVPTHRDALLSRLPHAHPLLAALQWQDHAPRLRVRVAGACAPAIIAHRVVSMISVPYWR